MCCPVWFASILLRTFASTFIRKFVYNFLCCCCCVLIWFWYQGNTGFVGWVWKCFFPFYFME
jgi:hypothetical protein